MDCFEDREPKTMWPRVRDLSLFGLIVVLVVGPVFPLFVVIGRLRPLWFWPALVGVFVLSVLALRAYWWLDRAAREAKRPRPRIELALLFVRIGGVVGSVGTCIAHGSAALFC